MVLPEHNIRAHLQPVDVCVFRSNALKHFTQEVEEDTQKDERWGISFYLCDVVQKDNVDCRCSLADRELK